MRILGRKLFCKTMGQIQEAYDYGDKLNEFFKENHVDGYLYEPNCIEQALSLLGFIFDDKDQWIDYWVYELDFGRQYKEGTITDANGENIPLETVEELYELLVKNLLEEV